MSKVYKIRKGKDIQLEGKPIRQILGEIKSSTVALKPTDFKGLTPKLEVQAGDEVKAGDALFHVKNNPAIKFTSPVSGEVAEIVRGDRRAIQEVRILADNEVKYKNFNVENASDKESIITVLLESGMWPCIIQRPFGTIANPEESPKAIHISTYNSAPLAADNTFLIEGDEKAFQKGLDILTHLTPGVVHLNHNTKDEHSAIFTNCTNVQHNFFEGPHPSGLVGVQIHHIDPINKGDVVWTLSPQSVAYIGRLFLTGHADFSKVVAIAGSETSEQGYVKTTAGVKIENLLEGRLKDGNLRVIGGDVLTGGHLSYDGYLGFYDNLLTVIPEGDHYEFMGWLIPTYARPTVSNSLPISKYLKKDFRANTNLHGEERAFVVSGQYEKVLPMDVLPVHLLKAILAQDLEAMENLGIFEIIEEDMALCEFVCTSKIEVQDIVRQGLELMEEEG